VGEYPKVSGTRPSLDSVLSRGRRHASPRYSRTSVLSTMILARAGDARISRDFTQRGINSSRLQFTRSRLISL